MTLEPFAHFEELGDKAAYARWNPRMKWFVGFVALIGLGAGLIAGSAAYATLGAFIGGAIGYGIFRIVVYSSSASTADQLYSVDWAKERGMTFLGDDQFPNNAPYAHSGDKRKATDAFEGDWNGLHTLFYNFTYTEEGSDSDDPDTDYDFKIMRLTGRELPISRLTIHQRSFMNKFKWVDALQGQLTPEKPVSLESVAFNEKFDLTIDDRADDIWIRRIFDPQTIAALVDGQFTIPDVQYYAHAWWFVEREHFAVKDLDGWIPKQKLAANAVELLSRVQTL